MIIAIILLSLALIVCAALIVLLKRDIKLLNYTLRKIEKTDTNMRATTETFDKDISELCNSINDILDKQKQAVAASEKSNREFRQAITNISHDLRTPLTSAVGYIQMLRSGNIPVGKKQEYLGIVERRLKSLSNLTNELFEYTQIIEGKISQNIEKINICNILRDTVSVYYNDFMSKNFTVEINIPDAPVYILCDVNSFKRIAQNLTQNVLAHGIEYFNLIVDVKDVKNDCVCVMFKNKVSDINAIDTERLFERFYTADSSRSGNSTGLGLAITKELILNIGGEINAYAEKESETDILNICVILKRTA